MRIPVSQGPQESLRPIAGEQIVAPGVRGPSTMRAVAGALGEVNQAITEADNIRIEEQINRTREAQRSLFNEARQQLGAGVLPKDGKAFTDIYLERFDKDLTKTEEGLSSNRQRRLFQQRSALLRQNLHASLEAHEADQVRVYADEVDTGTVTTEVKAARENVGNVKELALGQVRIEGSLASQAKRNGWAPERVAVERTKALTQFHGSVVGAALDGGKLDYAQLYLDQHEKDMDPETTSKARQILESEGRFRKVNDAVDQVESAGGTFTDKSKALREMFRDDDRGQKEAIQELHERKRQKDVAHDESIGALWDMRNGFSGGKPMSLREIHKTKEWASLDGSERRKLSRDFEADARRNEGKETPTEALAKYATFLAVLDQPEALLRTTDKEIIGKYASVLGASLTGKLLDQKRDIASSVEKLRTAKMDAADFNALASEYGLDVASQKTEKKKEEMRGVRGKLRDQVLDAIRSEQMRIGKELGQDEKEILVRKLMKKVPVQAKRSGWNPAGWLGSDYVSDGEKPIFQVADFMELNATDTEKTLALEQLVAVDAVITPARVWALIEDNRKKGQ